MGKRFLSSQKKVSRLHRWLGLGLTIPLFFWIVSSQILHYIGMTAPNGLQGVYELKPYNSVDVDLAGAQVLSPARLLRQLRDEEQLERIYSLKLQAAGSRLFYVVRPSPFALEMTFDAENGERLDPLGEELLLAIGSEKLKGSSATSVSMTADFNRDYQANRVPAALVRIEGEQPSELMLARNSGRSLRRFDEDAARFTWWYRNLHVFQWGDMIWFFTGGLFLVGLLVLSQTALGARLWWTRRKGRSQVVRTTRHKGLRWHRIFAIAVAFFLVTQVLVGAYMWLNLGPFEGLFRGKNTFTADWSGGLPVDRPLAEPDEILAIAAPQLGPSPHPAQTIEWRTLLGEPVWIVSARRDQLGTALSARTGHARGALSAEEAGRTAAELFANSPHSSFLEKTTYYWNDLNRRIPAIKLRMADSFSTDAFVCATTGEVISRRTSLWRAFGPFLRYHSFGWTGHQRFDLVLLVAFQLVLLGTIVSGLNLHRLIPLWRKRG